MPLPPDLAEIRFGTGLSPVIRPPRDADTMIDRLLGPDFAARDWPQRNWNDKVASTLAWLKLRDRRGQSEDARMRYREATREMQADADYDIARAIARAATTDDGLRERLLWFWADHFAISDGTRLLRHSAAGYHEDALRPHLAGRFADLLWAVVTHPAMIMYLDADRSFGPNSRVGRNRRAGVNENLAREMLELHTLGADGGYAQDDVRELATLLTGLDVDGATGRFQFRSDFVEPGAETVLGRAYPGDDLDAIRAVVEDLAVHPRTARHVSRKLARHFVSDRPDDDMVAAMAAAWTRTGGDLPSVYHAMLDHPVAAVPVLVKVRRPLDVMAATARALDLGPALMRAPERVRRTVLRVPMRRMGQPLAYPPGPDGFPEEAAAWITPQGLAARIGWAMTVPRLLPDGPPDPRRFVERALGRFASPRTRFAADAAETRADGVGLVLASPEFQRR